MSFESSDDENSITVHHIPWRSKSTLYFLIITYMHVSLLTSELNDFIQVLDDRAKSVAQSAKHFIPKSKERKDQMHQLYLRQMHPSGQLIKTGLKVCMDSCM